MSVVSASKFVFILIIAMLLQIQAAGETVDLNGQFTLADGFSSGSYNLQATTETGTETKLRLRAQMDIVLDDPMNYSSQNTIQCTFCVLIHTEYTCFYVANWVEATNPLRYRVYSKIYTSTDRPAATDFTKDAMLVNGLESAKYSKTVDMQIKLTEFDGTYAIFGMFNEGSAVGYSVPDDGTYF